MSVPGGSALRLLPWTTSDGKPCFLSGDGSGYLSRVADAIESTQLGAAGELVGEVDDLLRENSPASREDLRSALALTNEALRDVRRIAESRGARLSAPDEEGDAIEPYDGEDGEGEDGQGGQGDVSDGEVHQEVS